MRRTGEWPVAPCETGGHETARSIAVATGGVINDARRILPSTERTALDDRGNEVPRIRRHTPEQHDQTSPPEVGEKPHRQRQQRLGLRHTTDEPRRRASELEIGKRGGGVLEREVVADIVLPAIEHGVTRHDHANAISIRARRQVPARWRLVRTCPSGRHLASGEILGFLRISGIALRADRGGRRWPLPRAGLPHRAWRGCARHGYSRCAR